MNIPKKYMYMHSYQKCLNVHDPSTGMMVQSRTVLTPCNICTDTNTGMALALVDYCTEIGLQVSSLFGYR